MKKVKTKEAVAAVAELEPRRKPAQDRAKQTVDQVLQAAAFEIEQGGLDKLTTKRIAAAAGLSVGGLYEYFPNKEAVVYALAHRWLTRIRDAIDEVHPRHGGQRDVFTYLNDQFLLVARLYEGSPGLGALIQMLSAMPSLSALATEHDELVSANVCSALRHYAPNADVARVDAAARCIGMFCHSVLCAALVHKTAPPELLFAHLRVCLIAMTAPLLVEQKAV
ncbi:MAG: TetR family transcriptional regulator [Comamonadaceae bacterium]|nr:MAG: TetR family transcriptional regulator [Comamonadaceae bacterium]